jgi:hypothetical protein
MTRRALGNRVGNRGQFVMSLRLTHRVWKHKGLLTQGLTDAYSHWSPGIFEAVANYLGRAIGQAVGVPIVFLLAPGWWRLSLPVATTA